MLKQTSSTDTAEVQATVVLDMKTLSLRPIMTSASAFLIRSRFGWFTYHERLGTR